MPRDSRTEDEIVNDLFDKAVPNGDCLECHLKGSVDREGRERQYVQVGGREGIKWRATRLVYHKRKGSLNDLWVLHTCDNPKCINLDHLFLGTAQNNTDDMIAKGRKIDDPTVGPRRRYATALRIHNATWRGLSDEEICNRLLISPATLWNYRRGPYAGTLSAGD